jgi:hypothetical protein
MTRNIVIWAGSVVVLLWVLEPPARAEKCSAKEFEQLAPAAVTDEFRAAAWGEACKIILEAKKKDSRNKPAQKKGSRPRATAPEKESERWSSGARKKVADFCQDPTGAEIPSFSDVELVRAEAERVLSEGKQEMSSASNASGVPRVPVSSAPFFLGSAFQDDLLRGLAKFIVSRAKAEGLAFVMQRLKDKLCKSDDVQSLLPNTCALAVQSDPTGGAPMAWGTLKKAFETDLERLPERAIACVMTEGGIHADVSDILITGVQAARLIRRGEDVAAVAAGLAHRFPEQVCIGRRSARDSVQCALHMFGFAVRLLAPSTDGSGAVKLDANGLSIAARLMYEHAKQSTLLDGMAPKDLVPKLASLDDGLFRLAKRIGRANAARQALEPSEARQDSIAWLATALVDLAREVLPLMPSRWLDETMKHDIEAAFDTVEILAEAIAAAAKLDYARAFLHVAEAVRRFDARLHLPADLLKYGSLVVEVAAAQSADDVERALERAAAPIGGALAKRGAGRRMVAVSALVGVQGGGEAVDDARIDATVGVQGGLFAPVGIDVSWGVSAMHSAGVFVSLIDLGALMSFRSSTETSGAGGMASDATVESTPEVGFKQVLSPGLHFVWGIDRFALGAGVSLSPGLRQVTQDGEIVEADASSFRFGVFAAVDVTLFRL